MARGLRLGWPSRLIIVGGSHTGKTYLVRNMVLRQDYGPSKRELEIIVASPTQASLDQQIWKDLKARGFNLTKILIPRTGFPAAITAKPAPNKKKLIILDDVDQVTEMKGGRTFLLDLFGTESHHSNISVTFITHHLKFGSPAIINSTTAVIITGLIPSYLKDAAKTLGLTSEELVTVEDVLADPAGRDASKKDNERFVGLFNHIVVWMQPLHEIKKVAGVETSIQESRLYTFPRTIEKSLPLQPVTAL